MTGKELMLALIGAGIVGGAAGAAASFVLAPKTEAIAASTSPDVLYRLKATEDELARTTAALSESRNSINGLMERLTAAEMKAARSATETASATPAGRKLRVNRGARALGAKGEPMELGAGAFEAVELGDFDFDIGGEGAEQVAVEIGKALDGAMHTFDVGGNGELGAFRAGLSLRKLPEEERWQKAKDDLALTWNQVEDLKQAFAARDEAMKGATTVEKKSGPNGGSITIQRPDPAKSAHAEAAYHDRVNATLNDEQKKGWSAKGYDRAFGKSPFGGAGGSMVMAIDVSAEKHGEAPKDAAKDATK